MPHTDREIRLKRAYFRSNHRGSKEIDIILGTFATEQLSTLDDAQLTVYEAFLDENDNDIWDWVMGRYSPANASYDAIVTHLRARYALSK